ncbi:MAG: hypothetical protein ACKVS6_14280 [Planctomycetota bacterium]
MNRFLIASLPLILSLAPAVSAQGSATPVPPDPGDVCISELFFNALCVDDNFGEWFEVTNISGKVIDMNGLYFQDGAFPGQNSDRYFQVLPSVATLPPMYPGQRFVFARSNDVTKNNGIPQVDYWYVSASLSPPVDRSQVGDGQMNMGNQNPDGMHISIGMPSFLGGVTIASASYCPTAVPCIPLSDGISFERIDLYQSMDATTTTNSTNMAACLAGNGWGNCFPFELGTPGLSNSTDVTPEWNVYIPFNDTLNQNTGLIRATTLLSWQAGQVTFKMSQGVPSTFYTLGYAEGYSEIPLSFIFPGNPGSILLDLNSAVYAFDGGDTNYYFDAGGEATLTIPFTPDASLFGKVFHLQWLSYDFSSATPWVASNAISMVISN